MRAPRLTPAQARAVRSLVEDSGYSRKDARVLVLEGFPDEDGSLHEDRELADGEDRARDEAERDRDDTFVPDCEAAK